MTNISMKRKWVATDGWRGYETFENTIAGANDTGTYSDSPCPSSVRKREIGMATKILRKAGIRYRTGWARTSNVFSMSQNIVVAREDRERAVELLKPLVDQTRLLFVGMEKI